MRGKRKRSVTLRSRDQSASSCGCGRYHECENFLCLVLEARVAIVEVVVEERLQYAHVLCTIE
jgi:hypothetical protein